MIITAVTLRVEDYARWKKCFDRFAPARKAIGSLGGYLLRNGRSDVVMTVMKWADEEKARQFHESARLLKAMRDCGVVGHVIIETFDQDQVIDF